MLLLQLPIDRHPSRVNACYIRLNLLWCLEILDAMPASWFVVIKTVACSHAFICKICCESMSNMINSSYGLMLEGTGGLVPAKVCCDLNVPYLTAWLAADHTPANTLITDLIRMNRLPCIKT